MTTSSVLITGAVELAEGGDVPAPKIPHIDTSTSSTKWEWQSDSGWTAFDSEQAAAIEKAFKQKKPEFVLQVCT